MTTFGLCLNKTRLLLFDTNYPTLPFWLYRRVSLVHVLGVWLESTIYIKICGLCSQTCLSSFHGTILLLTTIVDLVKDGYTFGRGEECDYCFDLNGRKNPHFLSLSKTHFRIYRVRDIKYN